MEWVEFVIKVSSQLVWLAIALASIALTLWQLWDLYGFKIRAWWAAEVKARRVDREWRQWIERAWNTKAEGPLGS